MAVKQPSRNAGARHPEAVMAPKRGRAKTTAATGPINVVVDLSHHNETVDFAKMKAAGIVGVIHKATQGLRTSMILCEPSRQGHGVRASLGRVPLRRGRRRVGSSRVFST